MSSPVRIDCVGLRCPHPVLKLAIAVRELAQGTVVEVVGDCPTLESDLRAYCGRSRSAVLGVRLEGTATVVQMRI